MSTNDTPITHCTWHRTYQPSTGYVTRLSAMKRCITSRGWAKADRLTTARTAW